MRMILSLEDEVSSYLHMAPYIYGVKKMYLTQTSTIYVLPCAKDMYLSNRNLGVNM